MTNLLKSTLFAASMLFGLGSVASAETLHAKVPFTFTAAGTVLPAGTYTIRPLNGTIGVLLFENEETGARNIVFAQMSVDSRGKATVPLTFAPVAGSGRALTSIRTLSGGYDLSLRSAR